MTVTISRFACLAAILGLWFQSIPRTPAQVPASKLAVLKPVLQLQGINGAVQGVAFSPDGKWIATAGDDVATQWDSTTGKPHFRFDSTINKSSSVAFAPDGKTVAVGMFFGNVGLWNAETGKIIRDLQSPNPPDSIAYSPNEGLLAATHDYKEIMLFELKEGEKLATLSAGKADVKLLAFSHDGKTLAAMTDRTLMFWDVASRKQKRSIDLGAKDKAAKFTAFACSPAGPRVAASSGEPQKQQKTRFWDLTSAAEKGALKTDPSERPIKCLCFSPDGKSLASGHESGPAPVILWDVATGRKLAALEGSTDTVSQIAFSKDGKRLAASCLDKMVRVWDLSKFKPSK